MLSRLEPFIRPHRPPAPPIDQVEAQRDRHNYPGSDYLLPADQQEQQRLIRQHGILKNAFAGRALWCPLDISKAYFVLDSGTGAGIWLSDFAGQANPSSVLRGIDIESKLFPPRPPLNASFSLGTITSLPAEWTGRFDLVHQRLLLMALKQAEWVTAMGEMYRVLAPGGWVQLCEPGVWTAGPATARWQELRDRLFEHFDLLLNPLEAIPKLLASAGFSNVAVETRRLDAGKWAGQPGCDVRDNFLGVYRSTKPHLLKLGCWGLVASEKELDGLFDDVQREWDDVEGCCYDFFIVTAQKPV